MNQHNVLDPFPLSIALGEAFCNRLNETAHLKLCIEQRQSV